MTKFIFQVKYMKFTFTYFILIDVKLKYFFSSGILNKMPHNQTSFKGTVLRELFGWYCIKIWEECVGSKYSPLLFFQFFKKSFNFYNFMISLPGSKTWF